MNNNHKSSFLAVLILVSIGFSCKRDKKDLVMDSPVSQVKPSPKSEPTAISPSSDPKPSSELSSPEVEKIPSKLNEVENIKFTELTNEEHGIDVDLRYATTNNFTKKQIYDCGRCYLRPEAADALIKVHKDLTKLGYGLKVFDCFRPRPYQQRLWDIVPNPDYVTPPAKGSMHSRGLAVDLTVVDKNGKELDMGTAFDFFGKEAHTDFTGHNKDIIANRKLLTETMKKYGFNGIRTEWWHFSYNAKYQLDEWVWPCKVRKS